MVNKQDILTAIKNLDLFLKIPELNGAKARININGNPFVYVGGFNMVFQLTHNLKKWAFRVWHVPMGENKERYLAISKYLTNSKLPYFADFIYDENALLVNGELTDTIRMEWLDGVLLKDYCENNLTNKLKLEALANEFLEMSKTLRKNKISHGDLQEGNILVETTGKIRLVDYDSICIPEIEGQSELVTGLKGYQHPSRFKGGKASLKADYFSELIIYLSILGIASKPNLWDKYQVKDTSYLLFTETDFEDIESAQVYNDLKGVSPLIDTSLLILTKYLKTSHYLDLKPFTDYLLPPEILVFKVDKEIVIEGVEVEFTWSVENAVSARIEPEIGNVSKKGTLKFKPKNQEYKLIVDGHFENIEKPLQLKLFPLPIIETLYIPTPIFNHQTSIKNFKIEAPQINLGINLNPNIFVSNPVNFEKLNSNSRNFFLTNQKTINPISEVFEILQDRISQKLKNIFTNE